MKWNKKIISTGDINDVFANLSEATHIKLGDKVRINLKEIKASETYKCLSQKYKDFVESHTEDVFTVELNENFPTGHIVNLKEDTTKPKWLFFIGNLIKVEDASIQQMDTKEE